MHDVISFDIFDTLVLRPFLTPRDLWIYIESHYNCQNFYEQRVRCDVGEYANIDEQYANMPSNLQHMKDIECQLEIDLSFINEYVRSIYDLAKRLQKKIIIASDMYLSYDVIQKILQKHGIEYDKIYLSNDIKATKSSGSMFKKIKDDFSGLKILHIGDNAHSDVHMTKLYGIDAIHVENIHQKFINENRFILQALHNRNNIENRIFIALLSLSSFNFEAKYPTVSYWTKLGEIFGTTITVLYMQFIYDYILHNDICNVLFIARDGYILKNIFDSLHRNKYKTYYICSLRQQNDDLIKQNQFNDYIKKMNIKGKCVAIDLTSHNFSAQKSMSNAMNENVDELVFATTNKNDVTKSVVNVPWHLSWIFMLIECLFRAPSFPINDVNNNQVHESDFNMYELFFIETSNWMLTIQQNCAILIYKMLDKMNIKFDSQMFIDMFFIFVSNLSNFEKAFFKTLKHLSDDQTVLMIPNSCLMIGNQNNK